tara:strand:- start:974 stop:1195 length:222 start_codon:yes stop_codon:yes gene_type:complete
MVSYKYNPNPKWNISLYNPDTKTTLSKDFRSYTEVSNDDVWNKVIRNKDHFHNIFKRLKKQSINKHITILKLR